MARPQKNRLDYFPLDCDFLNDRRFRFIKIRYGITGISVYIMLLAWIYGNEGYFLPWNEETRLLLSDELRGCDQDIIENVVSECVQRNIFNADVFKRCGVLTSHEIQNTYLKAVANRGVIRLNAEYLLINIDDPAEVSPVIRAKISLSASESSTELDSEKIPVCLKKTPVFVEKTNGYPREKRFCGENQGFLEKNLGFREINSQSKVNKSIEKESIPLRARTHEAAEPVQEKNALKPRQEGEREGQRTNSNRIVPPSLEEVQAFSSQYCGDTDAESWYRLNDANGWIINGEPMRNWKAALMSWLRKTAQTNDARSPNPAMNYQQREYTESDYPDNFFFDPVRGEYPRQNNSPGG